ncbi:TetR/AcrR family transcriptional regulator [Solicola gregarius]|uniref:TetR/AcrR family transcriptional regulator n=1 Tax=Solicola gregarius TaxID=2908642 RepID=A0AA46YJP8_9ACTN|nr:TetR/AcrR family transcriptional regulator [Solicola gregarius]UYM04572.1 TetR/AcrR family transcriptional regulator [Solicola gregarius]
MPVTKGETTRLAILDEALQLTSRTGVTTLSIGGLARETGMSKSGLFAHFKSKESLQVQVVGRARERFVDTVVRPALAAPRGERRVRALFDGWVQWEREAFDGGCIFVTLAAELDSRPGPVRDTLVDSERDWLELIASTATTAVAEGDFRADLDTDQFAFEVHGVMLANHHANRLMGDADGVARAYTAFETMIAAARRTD